MLLATVLPMGCAAMVRADESIFLGLQVSAHSGDVSRDAAHALEQALVAPAGTAISASGCSRPRRLLCRTCSPTTRSR